MDRRESDEIQEDKGSNAGGKLPLLTRREMLSSLGIAGAALVAGSVFGGTIGTALGAGTVSGEVYDRKDPPAGKSLDPNCCSMISFDTIAQFTTTTIPAFITSVNVKGYYAYGDGGEQDLNRISTPSPVMAWHRQSADGSWWQVSHLSRDTDVRMFGAKPSNSTADATVNRAGIQNAIDFRYMVGGGGLVKAIGVYYFDDTIFVPMDIQLSGWGNRHQVLLEYGDTTSGVAHPVNGSMLIPHGPGTPRVFTDESNASTDTPVRVGLAFMGECAGMDRLTVQVLNNVDAWEYGFIVCGVSSGFFFSLDVRGPWLKSAHRLDATWGRTNPRIMARTGVWSYLATIPWFTADYATTYDFGLTNITFDFCRFEGASSLEVESGPNNAYAVNGISDTKYRACGFYNDQSTRTLATRQGVNGRNIRLNFRIPGLGGAQGFSLESCRVDNASRWAFDFDYWSNIDVKDGREFSETSQNYQNIQVAAGAPVEQQRGRLRTTTNTTSKNGDLLRFDGEFFFNLSVANPVGVDNAQNTHISAWVPRGSAGSRIAILHGQMMRTFNFLATGENSAGDVTFRAWDLNGRFNFQCMNGNAIDTYAFLDKTQLSLGTATEVKFGASAVNFYRNNVAFLTANGTNIFLPQAYTDTTASTTYVDIASDGRLRRSTSALKYKTDIRPLSSGQLAAVLSLDGISYKSLVDDTDRRFMGIVADSAVDLGLDELVTFGADGEVEGFRYDRLTAALLEHVKLLYAEIEKLKN